jgi:hypothetical protein
MTRPPPLESCDTDCRRADLGSLNPTCIRQHTSAYVSIRQHSSAYVSIRQHTSAYVSIRQHTSAYVSIRQHSSAFVSIRQHTSAYVSIRQHTSAYVSIRCRSRILKSNLWRWGPMLKIASILSLSGPIITRHVCASSLVRSILHTISSRNEKTKCANACGPNIL